MLAFFIHHNCNIALSSSTFATVLKCANVKPVFKKDDKAEKENHRHISILPSLSKIYERLTYSQMYPCFEKVLSKFLYCF